MKMTFPKFSVADCRTLEELDKTVNAIARIIQMRSLVAWLLNLKLNQLKLCVVEEDAAPDCGVYFLEGTYSSRAESWGGKVDLPDESVKNYHYFKSEKDFLLPVVNRIVEQIADINKPLTDEQRQALHSAVDRAQ